jgi:hypothetical protein
METPGRKPQEFGKYFSIRLVHEDMRKIMKMAIKRAVPVVEIVREAVGELIEKEERLAKERSRARKLGKNRASQDSDSPPPPAA